MYVCTYVRMHACMYMYVCMYVDEHDVCTTYESKVFHLYAGMQVCRYARMYVWMHACMYMYACMFTSMMCAPHMKAKSAICKYIRMYVCMQALKMAQIFFRSVIKKIISFSQNRHTFLFIFLIHIASNLVQIDAQALGSKKRSQCHRIFFDKFGAFCCTLNVTW
jgi:hypothetical protein